MKPMERRDRPADSLAAVPSISVRQSRRAGAQGGWHVAVFGIVHLGADPQARGTVMYQSYPTSGPEQQPERIQPPSSVRTAVKLMYAGAALSALNVIVALVTTSSIKSAILAKHPDYTATQLHAAETGAVVAAVVGGLIAVGLWVWMAWANGRGHHWARVVSAVLFGISTLDVLIAVAVRSNTAQAHTTGTVIIGALVWLVGLAAIVLIFRRQSGPFYRQQPTQP
jgi:hypothetical protein